MNQIKSFTCFCILSIVSQCFCLAVSNLPESHVDTTYATIDILPINYFAVDSNLKDTLINIENKIIDANIERVNNYKKLLNDSNALNQYKKSHVNITTTGIRKKIDSLENPKIQFDLKDAINKILENDLSNEASRKNFHLQFRSIILEKLQDSDDNKYLNDIRLERFVCFFDSIYISNVDGHKIGRFKYVLYDTFARKRLLDTTISSSDNKPEADYYCKEGTLVCPIQNALSKLAPATIKIILNNLSNGKYRKEE